MFEKPKIPEGYMSLADWKNIQTSHSEKRPLLLVSEPILEKKSINPIREYAVVLESPVQSKYRGFDCTKINELLNSTSITRNDVLKGIVIGMLFSIPVAPIAYSLGTKGSAIIAGIVSLITIIYCYKVHKNTSTSDFFKFPTPPVTITPTMEISNSTKNEKQKLDIETGLSGLNTTT